MSTQTYHSSWIENETPSYTDPEERRFRLFSGVFLWASVILPAILLAVVWVQPFVPVAELLRDPIAVAQLSSDCCHSHYGAISNLGVLIWCATAAICGFAAVSLYVREGGSEKVEFMTFAALMTSVLVLDDLYLLHDHVLPAFGVPQLLVYAVYAGLALAYLWRCRAAILNSHYIVFLAAGGLLATSILIDQVLHNDAAWRIMLEDGAKLYGICLWAGFHVIAAAALCRTRYAIKLAASDGPAERLAQSR